MQHKTILLVTHNVREAVVLSQRVIVLSQQPSTVLKDVRIDLAYPRYLYDTSVSKLADELTSVFRNNNTTIF